MIPINLPNGKTVFKTLDEWLNMTDEQYQDMIARDEGFEIDNPFDSALDHIKDNTIWDIPDVPEELPLEEVKKINKKSNNNSTNE